MSAMDHAAAHERIEDLLLEPARLAGVDTSSEPVDLALREHLAGCPGCRADLDGWRRLGRALGEALPASADEAAAAVEPIELPPSLRSRVIGAVHAAAQQGDEQVVSIDVARTARARARRFARWLGLAAALVVVAGAAGLTIDQAGRRAAAEAEAAALTDLVAAVNRVLATDHRIVEMYTPDGAAAGSISWSRHDWVVLTSSLTMPPEGQRYRCWLEDDGRSVPVGYMEFIDGTAYWVATLSDWQTWEIGPSTEFVVSLEDADAPARTGPIVLSADLGS